MHAYDLVDGHNWVRFQHKVLAIALLTLVGVIEGLVLVETHFRLLGDVLRLERTFVFFSDFFNFDCGQFNAFPLLFQNFLV